MLERISGEAVTSLVNQRIKHHVEHTCRGNFEAPFLESLEKVSVTCRFGRLCFDRVSDLGATFGGHSVYVSCSG